MLRISLGCEGLATPSDCRDRKSIQDLAEAWHIEAGFPPPEIAKVFSSFAGQEGFPDVGAVCVELCPVAESVPAHWTIAHQV